MIYPPFLLQVSSAGMISTNKSLDREDIPFYSLVVQASGKGSRPLTETVSVNVTILDINDNSPVFTKQAFTVIVSESLPTGTRFLNVTASDADIGSNALLTFSIMSGNTGDVMAIESSTGTLYNVGKGCYSALRSTVATGQSFLLRFSTDLFL